MILLFICVLIGSVFSCILGNNLGLFPDLFSKPGIKYKLLKPFVYASIGLTWSLAKIHCPCLETIVTYSFDNGVGWVLRAAYWKARVVKLGKNVQIEIGAKAKNWHSISIGDNSWIDRNVLLLAGSGGPSNYMGPFHHKENKSFQGKRGELIIGKGCHIAPNVVIQSIEGVEIGDYSGIASGAKIYSLSHHYRNFERDDGIIYKFTPCAPPNEQSLIGGPVVLQGNNAIGLNSVVLPGVTIGKNSWIGVNSCVINNVPPESIAMGCPAKVTKKRY